MNKRRVNRVTSAPFLVSLLVLIISAASCFVSAQSATFTNPIVKSGDAADPWMVYHDGYYYFTFTSGDHIEVWKSPTITGVDRGTKVTVWRPPALGPECCNLWAPELHFLNGRWYIYYAADDGNDANHRMYVLESTGNNAQGQYTCKGKISAPSDRWAIDGTVLRKADGSLYLIWSGWAGKSQGPQNLYISPMSNPWTVSAEGTLISAPTNSWETHGWKVNEGPEALQRNGRIFIAYSASGGSTPDYCLGLLTNTDGNVLNPASWSKSAGCVFAKTSRVFGPGHNSFVKSPDQTEDWIIYHARDTATETWAGRTARAQRFSWNSNGTPNFGTPVTPSTVMMTPSGEMKAVAAEPIYTPEVSRPK
jgi:GH43 family beta-xylosidase